MAPRDPLSHRFEEFAVSVGRPSGASMRPATLVLRRAALDAGGSWPDWVRADRPIPLFASAASPTADPGETLADLVVDGARSPGITRSDGAIHFHFDPQASLAHVLSEAHLPARRSWLTRLPSPVFRLPGPVRLAGHRLVGGRASAGSMRGDEAEVFPVDDALERLRLVVQRLSGMQDPPPWPDGVPPVVLSHDVDTAAGLRAAPRVAREEERLGLRSCFYVVGDRYRIDHGLLDDLRAAGHEVGLHGARHDFRLAYLPRERIEARLDRCRDMVERHGITGFRSPALLMSDVLAAALRSRFDYDSSVPDTDIRSLAGPRRGCGSAFPYLRDGLLCLPPTLPLDDRLLTLGRSPSAGYDAWVQKLAWLRQVGGMGMLATHTEPHLTGGKALLAAYRRFVETVVADGTTTMLPRDVARWWREGDRERAHGPDARE